MGPNKPQIRGHTGNLRHAPSKDTCTYGSLRTIQNATRIEASLLTGTGFAIGKTRAIATSFPEKQPDQGPLSEPQRNQRLRKLLTPLNLGSHMRQATKLHRKNGRRSPTRRPSSHRPYRRIVNPITTWQASKGEVEKGNTNREASSMKKTSLTPQEIKKTITGKKWSRHQDTEGTLHQLQTDPLELHGERR